MMKNKSHQVADFDSIVGDETSRQILASANLLPSSWNLPDLEVKRILGSGLRIKIEDYLGGINWPACANRSGNFVGIARDFLESESFSPKEGLAVFVHEIGHIMNPEPGQKRYADMTESERMDLYSGAMRPTDAPAGISELYADDYARYCDLDQALESGLQRLRDEYPDLFDNQVTIARLARIESGCEPELNLLNTPL